MNSTQQLQEDRECFGFESWADNRHLQRVATGHFLLFIQQPSNPK